MFDFNLVRNWYTIVPKTRGLNPFDKNVIRALIGIHKAINFPVSKVFVDYNCDTAYTDLNNIWVSGHYCSYENIQTLINDSLFYDEFKGLTSNRDKVLLAFCIYNTFFFHEKNHILYTYDAKSELKYVSGRELRTRVFNLIEDVFINNISMGQNINIFFKVFYTLMYNNVERKDYERLVNKIKSGDFEDNDYADYVLGHLFYLIFDTVVYDRYSYVFILPDKYRVDSNIKRRYDNVLRGLNNLFTSNKKDRYYISKDIFEFLSLFCESGRDGEEQQDKLARKYDIGSIDNLTFSDRTLSFGQELTGLKHGSYQIQDGLENRLVVKPVTDYSSNYPLEKGKGLAGFGKAYKYKNGIDRRQSNLYKSGKRIVEDSLVNFFIDGAIFEKDEDFNEVETKPETAILVDLSASMSSRILKVLPEVYGFTEGLKKANFPVSVWGHTTNQEGSLLVNSYCWNMKDHNGNIKRHSNLKERLNRLYGVSMSTNEDYLAITHVCANGFTGKNKKVLIVASDGKPSRGGGAVKETIRVVERLRRSGYLIFALSLTENVVGDNNHIYGSKFNLEAYGNKLPIALKQLGNALSKK